MRPPILPLLAALAGAATLSLCLARPAAAFDPLKPVCGAVGLVSGLAGKACNAARHAGKALKAGKQLLGGHVGGAVSSLLGRGGGGASVAAQATFALGLAAVGAWILGGAHGSLELVAGVIGRTTSPRVGSTWFSSTYWRMAAIATLLTLPFLAAAVAQALLRADLSLALRAALGYLPLSLLLVGIAVPLTMLLLAGTDAMSGLVSSAAGESGARFLSRMTAAATLLSLLSRSPFLDCVLGILVVLASVVLWLEMLIRAAAIDVVVLLLPLVFATLVWPARRVWAVRSAELLFALVLSKFAVVAVLSLGGAALGAAGTGRAATMSLGFALVGLAATAPWALMRLLPLAELASTLQGMHSPRLAGGGLSALGAGESAHEWADERALPPGEEPGVPLEGPESEVAKFGDAQVRTAADDERLAEPSLEPDLGAAPEAPEGEAGGNDPTPPTDPPVDAEWQAGFSDGRHLVIGEVGRAAAPPAAPDPASPGAEPLPPEDGIALPPVDDPPLPPPEDGGL